MTDDHSLERLGYFDFLGLVACHCVSEPGVNFVRAIRPLAEADALDRQALISELRDLSDRGRPLPLDSFSDVTPHVSRLKPAEAILSPSDLFAFLPILENAEAVTGHMEGDELHCGLFRLAGQIIVMPALRRAISRSISPEGKILDTASETLADIRRRIRTTESRLRRRLEELVREPEIEKHLQDDFITNRSGRWVIPVRRDAQSKIPGIVHDLSNTGETAFIEPLEILPLGNELGTLAAEERAEEVRVIRQISCQCRESSDTLRKTLHVLIELDGLRGMARLAEVFRMIRPEMRADGSLHIIDGRHPLLLHMMSREDKIPVPLDLSLDGRDLRAVVITGPNTGGKTVALKTVGLLCLMANSGMHVPATEGTGIPVLRLVAADIGDDQSIEQSLSTFSAHMKRAAELIRDAGPGSLLIFDELGAGTDPEEGGPLACSILEAAIEKGGLVLASTHLGAVKGFVHHLPHAMNAAVQFDEKTLAPTYRLEAGVPGQSHALDIANRYGLPEPIVTSARAKRGVEGMRLDALIKDLSGARQLVDQELASARVSREKAAALESELRKEMNDLRKKRREMLYAATVEADSIVRNARTEAEVVLKSLRDLRASTEEPRQIAREAREFENRLDKQIDTLRQQAEQLADTVFSPLSTDQLHIGDRVHVRSLGRDAVLTKLNLKGGRARVSSGGLDVEVALSELGQAHSPTKPAGTGSVHIEVGNNESVNPELVLIGIRVEPALDELDRFIDRALRAGMRDVRVVHGLGTGALSRAVRDALATHVAVEAFQFASRDRGGEAVTCVRLGRK